MKRTTLGLALATLAGTLALGTPATAQQIDTHDQGSYTTWDDVGNVNYGEDVNGNGVGPDRASFNAGETFAAPTGSPVLKDFSFWVGANPEYNNPAQALFRAFVLEWDAANDRPTGPVLYTSDPQHGTGDEPTDIADASTWSKYTFSPIGGLTLDPAKQYLALLSGVMEDGTQADGEFATNMVQVRTDSYAGGFEVNGLSAWLDPTESASLLTDFDDSDDLRYSDYSADLDSDAAFAASFTSASSPTTVTPEPVSMALLGTGLFGVGVAKRRRKKGRALA